MGWENCWQSGNDGPRTFAIVVEVVAVARCARQFTTHGLWPHTNLNLHTDEQIERLNFIAGAEGR
jgi:hypothetical protein